MKYKQLSIEERETIQHLLWQRVSIRGIAKTLGRSPSSVSRELQRNRPPTFRRYTPRLAQTRALRHRSHRGQRKLVEYPKLRSYVVAQLKLGWSPEQIAAMAQSATGVRISYEAIYQYVYAQVYRQGYGYLKPGCEDLRPYLTRRRKRRMHKGYRRVHPVVHGLLPSIDQRPSLFDQRTQVGHWEDDSLVFSLTCPVRLRSLNERVSGVVFIDRVDDRTMAAANYVTIQRLAGLPAHVRQTLTRDRGSEHFGYKTLEHTLGIRCYSPVKTKRQIA